MPTIADFKLVDRSYPAPPVEAAVTAHTSTNEIFVNGRFLSQPLSGIQRYGRELLVAMDRRLGVDQRSGEQWVLVTGDGAQDVPELDNMAVRHVGRRTRSHAWDQWALWRASRTGPLLSLASGGPILHPNQFVVIHDAAVYRHPASFSKLYGTWHRLLGRMLARRAAIGTVSRFSATELASFLPVAEARIGVFPNGSGHLRKVRPSYTALERLGLAGAPFFVCLGSITKNKNVDLPLAAIQRVEAALLVVIGGTDGRVFQGTGLSTQDDRVVFAGRLSDEEVAGMLRRAAALVFPSRYEGFGIPPLEAMMSDCPVIASDIPAVREVCGEAALYCDPDDVPACAAAMSLILSESADARARRVAIGRARADMFSWDATAAALIEEARRMLSPRVRQA